MSVRIKDVVIRLAESIEQHFRLVVGLVGLGICLTPSLPISTLSGHGVLITDLVLWNIAFNTEVGEEAGSCKNTRWCLTNCVNSSDLPGARIHDFYATGWGMDTGGHRHKKEVV